MRSRWWFKLVLAAGCGAVSGGFLLGLITLTRVPRAWGASASLMFPLPAGTARIGRLDALLNLGTEVPVSSDFPLDTYIAVLKSERALVTTAKQLDLPRLYDLPTHQAIVGFMREAVQVEVNEDRTVQVSARLEGTPRAKALSDLVNGAAAAERDRPYREKSRQVVLLLIDQMGEIADEYKLDRTKEDVVLLRKSLADAALEVDDAKGRIRELRRQAGLAGAQPEAYQVGLVDAYLKARESMQRYEGDALAATRKAALRRQQVDSLLRDLSNLSDDIPLLGQRRAAADKARQELDEARRAYGPESSQVLDAEAKHRRAQQELKAGAATVRDGMVGDLMALEADAASLNTRWRESQRNVAALAAELGRIPADLPEIALLQAELEQKIAAIGQLQVRLANAEQVFQRQGVHWKILDEPQVPTMKTSPSTVRSTIMGALIGLLLMSWYYVPIVLRHVFTDDDDPPGAGIDPA